MAKGPSPLRAKMAAYAARPYTDSQRINYENCQCDFDARPIPSAATLDRLADLRLSGGFNTRKSNICQTCFCARSVNGSCGC